MRFQTYPPSNKLKPYIKHFVVSEASDEQMYKVLPDTSLVMGFQYRGKLAYLNKTVEVPLATSGITGLQNTFRIFKNSPAVGSILVVFAETGAALFFKEPVNDLFGESLSLDNFTKSSILQALEEQVSEATSDLERIGLVEQFLWSRLQESRIDPLVTLAVQHIYQSKGTLRMTTLMDKLCISQSPLEKRFRRVVGTSPKKFSSIVRMKNTLKSLTDNQSLIEIALAAGYFDQAHFSRNFKAFTGVNPTEFLRIPTT